MGFCTALGIYMRKAERDFIMNITDDFHARNCAVVPYMEAENQMKDFISLHYEKEYRELVAPDLKLEAGQFFNHPIPGCVGEYYRRTQPQRSTSTRQVWMQPIYATEPYDPTQMSARDNKYERMLGFTVHEGPAFANPNSS